MYINLDEGRPNNSSMSNVSGCNMFAGYSHRTSSCSQQTGIGTPAHAQCEESFVLITPRNGKNIP